MQVSFARTRPPSLSNATRVSVRAPVVLAHRPSAPLNKSLHGLIALPSRCALRVGLMMVISCGGLPSHDRRLLL